MEQKFKKLTEDIKAKLAEALSRKDFQETITETKAATSTGTFEVIISTADRDRQGDIVMQDGWVLDNYKANPVVLWAHDYWCLPIGVCDSIEVVSGKLIAKGRFAAHEFAQEVRALYDAGMLRTTSVGFIPLETEGNVILRAELLEFSFVPVPANPMALRLANEKNINLNFAFAKGIMTKEDSTVEEEKPETEDKPEEETTDPIAAPAENGETETPATEEAPTEEPAAEGNNDTTTPPAAADNDGDENKPNGGDTTEVPSPQPEVEKPEGSGEGDGEPKETTDETVEPESKAVTQKAGRVLSDKNRTLIANTLANLQECTAALEELLTATEPEGSDSQGTAGKAGAENSKMTQDFAKVKEALSAHIETREVLRLVQTAVQAGLGKQNAKIRELKKPRLTSPRAQQ